MATHMSLQVQQKTTLKSAISFAPIRSGLLQRKCACGGSLGVGEECAECRSKRLALQRQSAEQNGLSTAPPIVHDVLRSPGQPLDSATRAFMEPRFGHDFSKVRVHTDGRAAESARAVNALAYTVGRDVVFGTGQYAPGTNEGGRLMAHELMHVVQQKDHSRLSTASLAIGTLGDAFEQEAQTTAERVMLRSSVNTASATRCRSAAEMTLRRQPKQPRRCPPTAPPPQQTPEQPPTCPPKPKNERGTCPDIKRERGELEQFAPSLETIAQGCYLIKNLGSGRANFGVLPEWDQRATQLTAQLKAESNAYLSIFGYSDCVEAAKLNGALRFRRALEVRNYFHKLGVALERIDFKAAEATKYVDTNTTKKGRARNRSVGIALLHESRPKESRYQVIGLGKRKKEIKDAGGNELDLAIAMLETECMQAELTKGGYPYGDGKTGNAANFGIFKQNWLMIRTSVPQYAKLAASHYKAGEALNRNLSWDIQVLHASQNHYGINLWFAGHRNGVTGLKYPQTHDIATYRNAVYWIRDQIIANPKYWTNDIRVTRYVIPI